MHFLARRLTKRAEEAKDAFRSGNTKKGYELIKVDAGKKCVHQSIGLKDQNGVVLYDNTDIWYRWYEYCKSLFAEDPNLIDRQEWDKVSFEDEPTVERRIMSGYHENAVWLSGRS